MEIETEKPVFNFSFQVKCIILLALGLIFYADSINNEYALDDGIVITQNEFVQQGFGGIGGIMTHDAYYSYYHQMNANQMLAGGRYRPLSIVVFAMEHSLFGEDVDHQKPEDMKRIASLRHLVSILAYMACIFVVFFFLHKYLLSNVQKGEDIAFLAALLFAIHPMHTEVVSNVKSLDEMMSLILILLTFIFALRYAEAEKNEKKGSDLYLASLFFLLALLAKEYALMLIFLLPLLFYTVAKKDFMQAISGTLPYIGVFILYLAIRIKSVGVPHNVPSDEILNNPYMLAKGTQKLGSEIYVLGKYLFMLFFPYPLSADYSYNQLPYRSLANPLVWLCIIIYGGIVYWAFKLLSKQKILAFPIFFYLANLFMVSNLLIDIGATMGERLSFHSSVGFVVLLSYGVFRSPSFKGKNILIIGATAAVVILCGVECIIRNPQWKNDVTLFTHDVNTVPNSIMANGNAGARYVDMYEQIKDTGKKGNELRTQYLNKSIQYLSKSIAMHPKYTNSFLNLGIVYYKMHIPDSAKKYWDIAKQLYPDHPSLKKYYPLLGQSYMDEAEMLHQQGKIPLALAALKNGLKADNTNPDLWYNLGGAYFTLNQWDSARYAWNATNALLQSKKDTALTRRLGPITMKGLSNLPAPTTTVNGIK
jgi:tetratricopeptide (TPR) repeat protein